MDYVKSKHHFFGQLNAPDGLCKE